jgi:ketosteroid isomerase-like protein
MSEENVEVVRNAYAALTRGDTDTLRDLASPELVVDFSRRLVLIAYFVVSSEEWSLAPKWL